MHIQLDEFCDDNDDDDDDVIMMFSYLLQLVDYLFRIISTYLDSTPCSFQYRIGALYALYAIYHTQLCQPKVKVHF